MMAGCPCRSGAWGSASYDLTGDGYPEVYLTSQGAEQAADAAHRTGGPDLSGHRDQARRHRDATVRGRRPAPVDGLASRVPGRQQRRLHRPVRFEGERRPAARLRRHGSERPVHGRCPTARSRTAPKQAGIIDPERGRGRGAGRLQRRRPARPGPGRPRRARAAVAQRRGRHGRRRGRDGPLAGIGGCANRGRIATRSGPSSRSASARHVQRRELTVGGGHVGGQLGWTHFGLGPAITGRRARDLARRRDRPVDRRRRGPVRDHRRGAAIGSSPGRHDDRRSRARTSPTRGPPRRHRAARFRDARPTSPELARRPLRRPARTPARADGRRRGYDRLVVYADREHSANLACLTRLRPALRGGRPHRRAGRRPGDPRRQRVLRDGRRRAAADAPRTDSRTSACRASHATGPGRSQRSSADEGIGPAARVGRRRLEDVRASARLIDVPGVPRRRAPRPRRADAGLVENATDLLIDAADGLRVINEVEQLAVFGGAACQTSNGVLRRCCAACARACASARPSACSSGTGRRCRATSC